MQAQDYDGFYKDRNAYKAQGLGVNPHTDFALQLHFSRMYAITLICVDDIDSHHVLNPSCIFCANDYCCIQSDIDIVNSYIRNQ